MKHGIGLGITLMACGVVEAADPPKASTPSEAPARPVLDLRVGQVRHYMMPKDYQAALQAPEPDASAIIVEGRRALAPMRQEENVPLGLPSLWYAAKDPKNLWRLFAPMVGTVDTRPPLDKIPPPVFRRGP